MPVPQVVMLKGIGPELMVVLPVKSGNTYDVCVVARLPAHLVRAGLAR